MKLFIAVRWGNADSPDGPDGEDTHFLIRAYDDAEASQLADEVLRILPTTSRASRREVEPFCHRLIEIGKDAGTGTVPQVLIGPWIAYGYDVHHYSYATWERDDANAIWQSVKRET